jgi:indole-3-glycerol phosphate synthase
MDILSKIIARKRLRIAEAQQTSPAAELRQMAEQVRRQAQSHAFLAALSGSSDANIIAEFKRCSPSKGQIRENADAAKITGEYESAGAAAISILTEADFFAGSLEDLRTVRRTVSIPILRKDFIVDEYQVFESAAAGADALLLIVAALDNETLARLLQLTEQDLGMDALVEVHDAQDLRRAEAAGAKLVGVNNRDLRTFGVSTETSRSLAPLASKDVVLISESGLTPDEVSNLKTFGYKGFLVGEVLMRAENIASALRAFAGRK